MLSHVNNRRSTCPIDQSDEVIKACIDDHSILYDPNCLHSFYHKIYHWIKTDECLVCTFSIPAFGDVFKIEIV